MQIAPCSILFFFFSSRRRHTRLQGDWSSDVCSSDIKEAWSLRPTLRVVMITAHGTRELLGEASQAGIHGMVLKLFTKSDMARDVQTGMEISRPLFFFKQKTAYEITR